MLGVRPSAVGGFKLTPSSNLVGCCTRRSVGFSPLDDLVDVTGGAPKHVERVRAAGQQYAAQSKFERRSGKNGEQ